MKKLVLVGACVLVSACVQAPVKKEPTAAQVEEQDRTTRAAIACGKQHAADIDDSVSDAGTVALALAIRCSNEYNASTEAFGATLDNETQRRMFRERRAAREARVEAFLPVVMWHRQVAKAK